MKGKINVIAIDGHSSCGKSSTAKLVAAILDMGYIDTGAMYRAVTLYFIENDISIENDVAIQDALGSIEIEFRVGLGNNNSVIFLNGKEVESSIRTLRVANKVSAVAALPSVRQYLVSQQRKLGEAGNVIMDGRDIGTNVFKDAILKVFMTASVDKRTERRFLELKEKGESPAENEIRENLIERDRIDSTRADNPLRQADDAVLLDTSDHTLKSQVDFIVSQYKNVIAKGS